MKSLAKEERKEIFSLFLEKTKLRFSDIEKSLKIRSNMASYHIEQMVKEGLLEKKDGSYQLTDDAEKFIPIFSLIIGQDISPLPAIIAAIIKDQDILLIRRNKRPYKGYWAMIGGKMLLDETFGQASLRLAREKAGIEGDFLSVNSVLHEQVKSRMLTKHSFILFFTKISAKSKSCKESHAGKLEWFRLDDLPERIVPSDLWLIRNRLDRIADVNTVQMQENGGELESFQIANQTD